MAVTNFDSVNAHLVADDSTRLVDRTTKAANFPGGVSAPSGFIGPIQEPATPLLGDGLVTMPKGNAAYLITKNGSAAAITLPIPMPGAPGVPGTPGDDGKMIYFIALTPFKHTLVSNFVGFNAKGSSQEAVFGGNVGTAIRLFAYQGNWYIDASFDGHIT